MKKFYLICLSLLLLFSQTAWSQGSQISISINQEVLNNFLKALAPIKGREQVPIMGKVVELHWSMLDPAISLTPEKGDFSSNIRVRMGSVSYTTKARGDAYLKYDNKRNKININLDSVRFELMTTVMGRSVKIKNVELSSLSDLSFNVDGPKLHNGPLSMSMPDGTRKTLSVLLKDTDVVLGNGMVRLVSDLVFEPVKK